jgi:hypothetical protein
MVAQADPAHSEVAQITLSRGKVMVYRDNTWVPVRIFTAVRAGEKIEMDSDAKLSLFFFKTSKTEQVHGAVKFIIADDGTHVSAANMAVRVAPGALLVAGGELNKVVSDQYAVGVRRSAVSDDGTGFRSFTPTRSLSTTPEFRWSPSEGAEEYTFSVQKDFGEDPFFTTTTKTTSAKLDKPLARGGTYVWTAEAGTDKVSGTITVLTDAEVKSLDGVKAAFQKAVQDDPDDSSAYLLLAARYKSENLPFEQLNVLHKLSERNPKDPFPHKWMAEVYEQLGMTTEQKSEEALSKGPDDK